MRRYATVQNLHRASHSSKSWFLASIACTGIACQMVVGVAGEAFGCADSKSKR